MNCPKLFGQRKKAPRISSEVLRLTFMSSSESGAAVQPFSQPKVDVRMRSVPKG